MSQQVIKPRLGSYETQKVRHAVDVEVADLNLALVRRIAVRYGLQGIAIGFVLGAASVSGLILWWVD